MNFFNKGESIILFLGDAGLFFLALFVTLFVRYSSVPSAELLADHAIPFSIIFLIWVFVFFIAGLYEKHTLFLKSRIPSVILRTQIANSIIAVLFFYFVPYFGITPKTNLFIDLFFSFVLILLWRIYIVPLLGFRHRQQGLLIGSGDEMKELNREVNENPRYNLKFISSLDLDDIDAIDFKEEILDRVYGENVSTIVIDIRNEKVIPVLPHLYNLIFSKIRFVDKYRVYEDIFDRVPLSLINYDWFIENISSSSHVAYDILKRAMDMSAAFVLAVASLVVYPFVMIGIALDDGFPIFIKQERVGKGGKTFSIVKFRTMTTEAVGQSVTKFGLFLRKTRIDELPQLWNVLRGDISLVGPRPELPRWVKLYEERIPYYNIRHLIKPGLSGWAQIHQEKPPKFDVGYDETKIKLSYDLYYIKNRSFLLDVKIALKTLKILMMRSGI